jgi:hypothetical protein
MPQRLLLLKVAIGLFCVVFAHFLGRALARKERPKRRGTSTSSWALRTLLAAGALAWPSGTDWLAIAVYAFAAASAALGFFLQNRPKKPDEDLTSQMFPGER